MTACIAIAVAVFVATFSNFGISQSNPSFERVLADCTVCHGEDGYAAHSNIPHIRAQNYDYLVNQLSRFARLRPGSSNAEDGFEISPIVQGIESIRNRSSEIMEQHAGILNYDMARNFAHHFSELPCRPVAKTKAIRAAPEGFAWCEDCHAVKKAKSMTNVPLLNGQNADYLEAQLLAFKRAAADADQENARLHHFMSRSIRNVSGARLRAVSEFYAAQACTP